MKPLITYVFFAYNQRDFMQEAVSSVLNQKHPKLEIIFSDDCSDDGTFEEIERIVASYQGSHKLILNKNKHNLGIPQHLNKVVGMASGKLIVVGAGDDISLPNRVLDLESEWKKTGISCIFSNSIVVDDKGREQGLLFSSPPRVAKSLDEFKLGLPCWANGASLAFEKELLTRYGSVPTFQEDGAIAFRGLLEKGVGYIHKPLIKYRKHEQGISSGLSASNRLKFQVNECPMREGWHQDAVVFQRGDKILFKVLNKLIFTSRVKKWMLSVPFFGLGYNKILITVKKVIKGD